LSTILKYFFKEKTPKQGGCHGVSTLLLLDSYFFPIIENKRDDEIQTHKKTDWHIVSIWFI